MNMWNKNIFHYFAINKSINKALLDVKDLYKQINEISTTKNTINKIYQILCNKIRISMNKNWEFNILGTDPSDKEVPS